MRVSALADIRRDLDRERDAAGSSAALLIAACVAALDVTGAGIMVMIGRGHRGSVGGSDDVIRLIEELQFTLGVGPCIDTCRTGLPVLEPDLAHPVTDRWPELAPSAVEAGVAAIFAFPVVVGGIGLGALDLYQSEIGDLRPEQYADAIEMADVVGREILAWQADAPAGTLASELDQPESLRLVVHQASGMLSVSLGISIEDALMRVRAYAYAEHRSIDDVAADVVTGVLVIER